MKKLRQSTDDHRELLWRHLEMQVGNPWFLGDTWSALDIYLADAVLATGRDWFAAMSETRAMGVAMSNDAHCQAVAKRRLLTAGRSIAISMSMRFRRRCRSAFSFDGRTISRPSPNALM